MFFSQLHGGNFSLPIPSSTCTLRGSRSSFPFWGYYCKESRTFFFAFSFFLYPFLRYPVLTVRFCPFFLGFWASIYPSLFLSLCLELVSTNTTPIHRYKTGPRLSPHYILTGRLFLFLQRERAGDNRSHEQHLIVSIPFHMYMCT